MNEILLLLLVFAIALYWQNGMRCKEIASNAARLECKRENYQFLDQTVHQQHISMSRDTGGTWRFWRDYRFEYSIDGIERRRGRVLLLGQKVVSVNVETINTIIH